MRIPRLLHAFLLCFLLPWPSGCHLIFPYKGWDAGSDTHSADSSNKPDIAALDGPDDAVQPPVDSGFRHLAPFLLNFDAGDGQLVGTRDWQWGYIAFKAGIYCDTKSQTPPSKGHSGMGMWGTRLNDCYRPLGNESNSAACINKNPDDDSILTLKAFIPASMKTPKLSYWEWVDHNPQFDWSEVRINGAVGKKKCGSSMLRSTKWVRQEIDLSTYTGNNVTITFHFMATYSGINNAGWYLDDLAINQT